MPTLSKMVETDLIAPPPQSDNNRKVDIKQLAESIKAIGLINPITLAGVEGAKKFEIIAGRRRYWACLEAGLDKIPCTFIINTLERDIAGAIKISENLHRLQLSPMQEAEAIQKLRTLGHSDESIAADLGMTRQFVARRSKLLDLSPEWKKALLSKPPKGSDFRNSSVPLWPVACLELIARYPAERQTQLFEYYEFEEAPDVESLKKDLSRDDHNLFSAPWKMDDESLCPKAGACNNCPKRSSVEPLLFDDVITKKKSAVSDICLDPKCWNEKMSRLSQTVLEQAQTKHPDAVPISAGYYLKDKPANVVTPSDYTLVSKKTPGAKQALFIDGPKAGTTTWIKSVSDRLEKRLKTVKKKKFSDKDRTQRLRDRRNKWIIDVVRQRLGQAKKDWPVPSLKTALAAATTFGLGIHYDFSYRSASGGIEKDFKNLAVKLAKSSEKELGELFWKYFRQDMERKLCVVHTGAEASVAVSSMTPLFQMMGTTLKQLWADSAKEIPDRHNYLGEKN